MKWFSKKLPKFQVGDHLLPRPGYGVHEIIIIQIVDDCYVCKYYAGYEHSYVQTIKYIDKGHVKYVPQR